MTRVYAPPVTAVEFLRGLGVEVVLDFAFGEPQQCDWCAETDALTSVRVYRDTDPEATTAGGYVEACQACAVNVLREALNEQSPLSRRAITVEVAS